MCLYCESINYAIFFLLILQSGQQDHQLKFFGFYIHRYRQVYQGFQYKTFAALVDASSREMCYISYYQNR